MTDDVDLDELRCRAEQARRAAGDIGSTGGLAGTGDLAKRWGISYDTVVGHTRHPEFPVPIDTVNGQPVWLVAEADFYRHTPRKRGPRGPRPQ